MDDKANSENTQADTGLTSAERKLLRFVRKDDLSRVTVQLSQGKILRIETEEEIPKDDLDAGLVVSSVRIKADKHIRRRSGVLPRPAGLW